MKRPVIFFVIFFLPWALVFDGVLTVGLLKSSRGVILSVEIRRGR